MHSHNHLHTVPKKSNMLKNILFLVGVVIILIGLFYYHVQNRTLVIGGAITIIVAHLAIAGGAAHIIPTLKKRFHREPAEQNPPDDVL